MSTIAWDGKTLAADTLVNCDGGRCGHTSKIYRWMRGDGVEMVVAGAGELAQLAALCQWLENPEMEKPSVEKMEAIALTLVKGKIISTQLYDHSLVPFLMRGPTALGSGWQWAMAAMDHGKSATQAVEYAITRDVCTGGEIETIVTF